MIDRFWYFVAPAAGAMLVAAACNGCRHDVTIESPPAVPTGDTSDVCARACAQLAALGCADGKAANCADACRTDQAQGVGAQLQPACVADAGTVGAVKACGACQ